MSDPNRKGTLQDTLAQRRQQRRLDANEAERQAALGKSQSLPPTTVAEQLPSLSRSVASHEALRTNNQSVDSVAPSSGERRAGSRTINRLYWMLVGTISVLILGVGIVLLLNGQRQSSPSGAVAVISITAVTKAPSVTATISEPTDTPPMQSTSSLTATLLTVVATATSEAAVSPSNTPTLPAPTATLTLPKTIDFAAVMPAQLSGITLKNARQTLRGGSAAFTTASGEEIFVTLRTYASVTDAQEALQQNLVGVEIALQMEEVGDEAYVSMPGTLTLATFRYRESVVSVHSSTPEQSDLTENDVVVMIKDLNKALFG